MMRERCFERRTGRALLSVTAVLLGAQASLWAAGGWTASYVRAMGESKRTGKPVLANFTSTRSCPYCAKLRDEVLRTATFAKWAKDKVVLLDLDGARAGSPVLARQRAMLMQRYGVTGVPTVLFLDHRGNVLGRSGYYKGGAENWTTLADRILAAAPKPEKLEPLTSLTKATAAARDRRQPLLVLAGSGKSGSVAGRFQAVLDDADLAAFAKDRLVVVRVDTDEGAGGPADREAYAELLSKHELRRAMMQTLAIDLAAGKVLYSASSAVPAKYLIPRLLNVLPKPKYDGAWIEDYAEARKLAHGLYRPMLLHFTGSDWCAPCKDLERDVFSRRPFQALAKRKLVLARVDLPKQKQLPPDRLKQNQKLARQHRVRGFPTLVVVGPSGTEKGRRSGYSRGGARTLLAWLNAMTK